MWFSNLGAKFDIHKLRIIMRFLSTTEPKEELLFDVISGIFEKGAEAIPTKLEYSQPF